MLYEDDVDFKFFKKLYFFAKFISGPGIECWCFNRLCILKCVLNGWLYSFTGIVNSCILEVVNNSNIDFFIGALIQNQQGQHQLNLVSIKMFEEIFLFLSMPYWCSKDCHFLRSYRLLMKKFYKQSEKVLNWPWIFSSKSWY